MRRAPSGPATRRGRVDPPSIDPIACTARFFEEEQVWGDHHRSEELRRRLELVRSMIPPSARAILDVGCGDGQTVEALRGDRPVIGLDPSRAALARFGGARICALGEALPIRTGGTDLACCLEVLEHLEDGQVAKVSAELARVAGRWILVATPDREDPRRNNIRCPRCGLLFNRSHHRQTFSAERLEGLFPGFSVRSVRRGGQAVRPYPYPLLWLRHRIARRFYKGPGETRGLCPGCGNRDFEPFRPNLLSILLDGMNRLLSQRRPYWVLLLLERIEAPAGGAGAIQGRGA